MRTRSARDSCVRRQAAGATLPADIGINLAPGGSQSYDYGVVSLALSRPFEGTWADLLTMSQAVMSGAPLDAMAEAVCRAAAVRLRPALTEQRETFLSEDYFVFGVTAAEGAPGGDTLLSAHGDDIARLLRGETEPLSAQERDEVLEASIVLILVFELVLFFMGIMK